MIYIEIYKNLCYVIKVLSLKGCSLKHQRSCLSECLIHRLERLQEISVFIVIIRKEYNKTK